VAENSENYVDELDFAILAHLQVDWRRSFTDIAKDLNIAVGTVRNRVTKLLEDCTLKIIGRVDPYRVGFTAPATINVNVQPMYINDAIEEIEKFPEVSYLALVTGEYDLVVDVMCENGSHLTEFLTNRLSKVIGVNRIQTSIVLKICKVAQPDLKLIKSHHPLPESYGLGIR
jgi:Lrp/AsnC family transcriptional regulator, regulator for asnA, asnC and gidA